MATAPHGRESAEQTPERPGAPTDPQTGSGGSPGTRHEAHTPHATHADSKTARQKIADWLWWGVPSSTDEEAKARTEELLDEHAAEVRAENGDAVAERDCLAMAVLFARQWSGGTPFELHKGIDEILATMPAADAAADFFRPGRTYAYDASGFTAPELLTVFRVVTTTIHPSTGKRTAFGWLRTAEAEAWTPYSEPADEWPACWTDVTTAEGVAS